MVACGKVGVEGHSGFRDADYRRCPLATDLSRDQVSFFACYEGSAVLVLSGCCRFRPMRIDVTDVAGRVEMLDYCNELETWIGEMREHGRAVAYGSPPGGCFAVEATYRIVLRGSRPDWWREAARCHPAGGISWPF